MKKVIIIGGGAAGMMAAYAAAKAGAKVCLIEKNEKLGKKLFITGKGRCNVTNVCDRDSLLSNICTNPKFLYPALNKFDNQAVLELFEQNGCPLKIERGERVFPVSDHSSDVIGTLQRMLKALNVELVLREAVEKLMIENTGEDRQRVCGVKLSGGKVLRADSCIVCTGGISYPSTGSTGDGYTFALESGHRVVDCRPALVPLEVREPFCGELMGLALKNITVCLKKGKKEIYEGFGEMLFTHFGVSGPLILSASSYYVKKYFGEEVQLFIDLKPALSAEQLDKRILRDFEESKNKQFKNTLGGLFPAKLIPVMVTLSGINPEKRVNEITKEERRSFVTLIKAMPLTVTGTRSLAEAIITQGGVSAKDINPSTMESKRVDSLYFAGEVLDIDAMTGGFNLQIAWSTGYLAGESAAKEEQSETKFQTAY